MARAAACCVGAPQAAAAIAIIEKEKAKAEGLLAQSTEDVAYWKARSSASEEAERASAAQRDEALAKALEAEGEAARVHTELESERGAHAATASSRVAAQVR